MNVGGVKNVLGQLKQCLVNSNKEISNSIRTIGDFLMNTQLVSAIATAQRAQRNYDLSKTIPDNDLQTLIYAATNSPSKQNEVHYSLHVYTDQTKIREIYNCTKLFSVNKTPEEGMFEHRDGKFWQDETRSVYNSQILANVLFVYLAHEGAAIGGTHLLAKQNRSSIMNDFYQESKSYSIGISIGELILSANLLGYKTGICSAMNADDVAKVINVDKEPKVLVGIGFENTGVDRRLHAETKNSELAERFRSGDADGNYRFPSFEKTIDVKIN